VVANAFKYINASVTHNEGGENPLEVTVTFPATGAATVTDLNLTLYIPKPVTGNTPSSTFFKTGLQYNPSNDGVKWYTENNAEFTDPFAAGTVYRAEVTLAPLDANFWTFDGLGENSFTHDDADSVSYVPAAYKVTVTFPATAAKVDVTGETVFTW
jgi:hypothetical protein